MLARAQTKLLFLATNLQNLVHFVLNLLMFLSFVPGKKFIVISCLGRGNLSGLVAGGATNNSLIIALWCFYCVGFI